MPDPESNERTTTVTQQAARAKQQLDRLHMRYPSRGIVSFKPAAKWDHSTVVGNGTQGALAFAQPLDEQLILSHEELFLPLFPFVGYLPVREHYHTIQRLVIEGKADEAQQLIRQLKFDGKFPHYNTTDPFVGAGALDLLMPSNVACDDYAQSVDFQTGQAMVAWRQGSDVFHRQLFISRADDVLVVRVSSPTGAKINLSTGLREIQFEPPTDPRDHNIYEKTIDRCVSQATPTHLTHEMHFKDRWPTQAVMGCAIAARVLPTGGSMQVVGRRLTINHADEVLLMLRTVPLRRVGNVTADTIARSLDQIQPNYDALLASHEAIHREMFDRCQLRLSSRKAQQRAGEDMQASSHVGCTDPALVEKTFDASRYGIIASTGKLPPALQGVWTGTWKPMWSGDYTLNGNVQSMVAASLCSNHYECQQAVMAYLDSLMDDFRENARELLGFRGPLIPWRSSTHGKTHYLAYRQYHHNFPGIFWFAGAAWYAQIYYDYYLYTGDESFFADRLAPFLLDAVAFYEDLLTVERDGKFIIAPDSSAENETAPDIWMAPNPTNTIAGIKQLLRTVMRHADQLHATEAQIAKWQKMLSKLPDYAIGANGALKEWTWPGIENDESHRHASHLYPLYFGVDPEIADSPLLQQACRVAIEQRLAPRREEQGGFMAFGHTQLGMSAAHLDDSDHAYECVEYLVNSYWSPIMVSQHNNDADGPGVLNMDISGGLPAVIITMLIQSLMPVQAGGPWVVKLLPCLPRDWQSGSLTGVRCRGGFEVDLTWHQGRLQTVMITSLLGGAVDLKLEQQSRVLEMQRGEQRTLTADAWSESK